MPSISATLAQRWALIARAPRLGAAQVASLVAISATLDMLERPDAASLAQLGLTTPTIHWLLSPDRARIEADLRWLESPGHGIVTLTSPEYPDLLRHMNDPPTVLFTRGTVNILAEPQIAMVGR